MSQKYPSMRLQAKGLNKLLQSWSDYFVILKPDVLELMKGHDQSNILGPFSLKQACITLQYNDNNDGLKSVTLGNSDGVDQVMFRGESPEELLEWARLVRSNVRALDKIKRETILDFQPEANFQGKVLDIGWCHVRNMNRIEDTPSWSRKFAILTDSKLALLSKAPQLGEEFLECEHVFSLVETRLNLIDRYNDALKTKRHIAAIRDGQQFLLLAFETATELQHWLSNMRQITFHNIKKSKQYSFLVGDRSVGSYLSVGLVGGLMLRDSRFHLVWSYGVYHLKGVAVNPGQFAVPKAFYDALGKTATLKSSSNLISKNEKLDAKSVSLDFGTRNPKVEGKTVPIKLALGDSALTVMNILLNVIETANVNPHLVPKPQDKKKGAVNVRERASSSPSGLNSAEFSASTEFTSDNMSHDASETSSPVTPYSAPKGRQRSQTSPVEVDKKFVWDKVAPKQKPGFIPKSSSALKNSVTVPVPETPVSPEYDTLDLISTYRQ